MYRVIHIKKDNEARVMKTAALPVLAIHDVQVIRFNGACCGERVTTSSSCYVDCVYSVYNNGLLPLV